MGREEEGEGGNLNKLIFPRETRMKMMNEEDDICILKCSRRR